MPPSHVARRPLQDASGEASGKVMATGARDVWRRHLVEYVRVYNYNGHYSSSRWSRCLLYGASESIIVLETFLMSSGKPSSFPSTSKTPRTSREHGCTNFETSPSSACYGFAEDGQASKLYAWCMCVLYACGETSKCMRDVCVVGTHLASLSVRGASFVFCLFVTCVQ